MVSRYQYESAEGGMRRRCRHNPNTSESTGKIGQELPSNQPAPLVPLYPDQVPDSPAQTQLRPEPAQEPVRRPANAGATGQRPPRQERPAKQDRPLGLERPAKQ